MHDNEVQQMNGASQRVALEEQRQRQEKKGGTMQKRKLGKAT
jgi:hypothetical protein